MKITQILQNYGSVKTVPSKGFMEMQIINKNLIFYKYDMTL